MQREPSLKTQQVLFFLWCNASWYMKALQEQLWEEDKLRKLSFLCQYRTNWKKYCFNWPQLPWTWTGHPHEQWWVFSFSSWGHKVLITANLSNFVLQQKFLIRSDSLLGHKPRCSQTANPMKSICHPALWSGSQGWNSDGHVNRANYERQPVSIVSVCCKVLLACLLALSLWNVCQYQAWMLENWLTLFANAT